LGLTACGLSDNKYSNACKQLELKCKNYSEFSSVVLRKGIDEELIKSNFEIEKITNEINRNISRFVKKSFSVDVAVYKPTNVNVQTMADRIIENIEKVDNQKIYVDAVTYHPQNKLLKNLWGFDDEIEVRNRESNRQIHEFLKTCDALPANLCKFSFIGEITAIKTEKNWKGWVEIKEFNAKLIEQKNISYLIKNQVASEIRGMVETPDKSKLNKDSISLITKAKIESFLKK
jgi:hypothetical protein